MKNGNTHEDILRTLATILEDHVETAQSKGFTPLLDGIEMARIVRAIASYKPVHRPNMVAAQGRLDAVVRGQQFDIMAPNIEWPVDAPRAAGEA